MSKTESTSFTAGPSWCKISFGRICLFHCSWCTRALKWCTFPCKGDKQLEQVNRRGTSQGVEEEGAIKQLHAFSCFLLSVSGLVVRWDQDCIQGPDPKKERKKREIRNGVTTTSTKTASWRMSRVQVTSCNAHSTQICPLIQVTIIRRLEIEGPRCRNR